MGTPEKGLVTTHFTPGQEAKLVTYKPESIYGNYTGPFPETLDFNDDGLEEFRERVGRMEKFLRIQTLDDNWRNISIRPLPYCRIRLRKSDPGVILAINPSAIDINIQDEQRSHNGGQTFYKEKFKSDLRLAVVETFWRWGSWEIDNRQDRNFFEKTLRKKQLKYFLKNNWLNLFQSSYQTFSKPGLTPELQT